MTWTKQSHVLQKEFLASVKSKNIPQMETSSSAKWAWRKRACPVQMQLLSSRLLGDPEQVPGWAAIADLQDLCVQISLTFSPREWAPPRCLIYPSFLPGKMLRLDIMFAPGDGTQVSLHPMLSLWKWRLWHRIGNKYSDVSAWSEKQAFPLLRQYLEDAKGTPSSAPVLCGYGDFAWHKRAVKA